MKIFVDMQKLKAPNSGLAVFCKALGQALVQQANQLTFSFFVPEDKNGCFGSESNYILQKAVHKIFSPPSKGFDVWHCTHQDSNCFPTNRKTKVLLTIHDLNFLYKYTGIKKHIKHYQLQRRINKAHALAYISAYTQQDVRNHFTIGDKPEYIVYNGLSTPTAPQKPAFVKEGESFFFTIGIINPKKNTHVLPPLLTAYPNHKLIIAGKCDTLYRSKILTEAENNNVSERIVFCDEISDAEKYWLYANCNAFFFPSLSEGFGLPVVEAMQFGVPVFLSHRTALPEIGGDVCYYWHSFERGEMLNVLQTGMAHFTSQPEIKTAMIERAHSYSWATAATQYINIYKKMML